MLPRQIRWLLGVVVAGSVSACASTPMVEPADDMATAEYAIDQAQQNGAAEYAQLQLYKAQQKFEKAEAILNQEEPAEGEYAKARRLAEKATLDAQFALAKTKARRAQAEAADLRESIATQRRQLRSEGAVQ